jgi:antitoxin VapB
MAGGYPDNRNISRTNDLPASRKKPNLNSTMAKSKGALNIKNPTVAEKARKLARLKGTSITNAVSEALDASLNKAAEVSAAEGDAREREVDEILKRFRASIPPDAPTYQEIMDEMYDEDGLPR